jgi:hypothetical protein
VDSIKIADGENDISDRLFQISEVFNQNHKPRLPPPKEARPGRPA